MNLLAPNVNQLCNLKNIPITLVPRVTPNKGTGQAQPHVLRGAGDEFQNTTQQQMCDR